LTFGALTSETPKFELVMFESLKFDSIEFEWLAFWSMEFLSLAFQLRVCRCRKSQSLRAKLALLRWRRSMPCSTRSHSGRHRCLQGMAKTTGALPTNEQTVGGIRWFFAGSGSFESAWRKAAIMRAGTRCGVSRVVL